MTDINMISHYASRMKAHINQAVYAMECKDGLKNDKAAVTALCCDIMNDLTRVVEECTGRREMLNRSMQSIYDDLSDAFDDLIEAAEEAEQDERDQFFADHPFASSAVATVVYDGARGK